MKCGILSHCSGTVYYQTPTIHAIAKQQVALSFNLFCCDSLLVPLFCLAQLSLLGPLPPATALVSMSRRALPSTPFSVSLSHLATQFHGFNPYLGANRTQISIFSLEIAPQSSRSIFSTASWTTPPECAARNSVTNDPRPSKNLCAFSCEECHHSPSCSSQKPGYHP